MTMLALGSAARAQTAVAPGTELPQNMGNATPHAAPVPTMVMGCPGLDAKGNPIVIACGALGSTSSASGPVSSAPVTKTFHVGTAPVQIVAPGKYSYIKFQVMGAAACVTFGSTPPVGPETDEATNLPVCPVGELKFPGDNETTPGSAVPNTALMAASVSNSTIWMQTQ